MKCAFPNLLGMKAYNELTAEQMGQIIGKGRETFEKRMKQGDFTPQECMKLCKYFKKPFEYLFAEEDDIK